MPERIILSVQFEGSFSDEDVEKEITRAFQKEGIKVTKFRYTYVETNKGIGQLGNNLLLALLLSEKTGFRWKLPELSGKYLVELK